MSAASSSAPQVRLSFRVLDKGHYKPQERLIRVTEEYEVVDVDGFLFKRKRKDSLPVQYDDLGECKRSRQDADDTSEPPGPGAERCTEAPGLLPLLGWEPTKRAATALAEVSCEDMSEMQRLVTLVGVVCDTARRAKPASSQAEAVTQALLEEFRAVAEDSIRAGDIGNTQHGSSATKACVPRELQPPTRSHRWEVLREQGAALQAERSAWKELEAQGLAALGMGAGQVGEAGTDKDRIEEDKEREHCGGAAAVRQAEALARAQSTAVSGIALQVEEVAAMMASVKKLLSQAGCVCDTLQAQYHDQRFRAFPHVASPAVLIKEILAHAPKKVDAAAAV